MSIESFSDRYNVPDIKQEILKERERYPQLSTPAFLTMRFADFGAEELKREEAKIADQVRLYVARFGQQDQIRGIDLEGVDTNYTAVVFGLSLRFMDDALLWGVFDKPGFVMEHNKRIEGSQFYTALKSGVWEAQVVTNDNLRKMRELALQDKTLSVLFQEGYPLMPYFIQQHVGHGVNLECIRRRIIPIYQPLAQEVGS